jgi:hypothetical protein
MTASPARAANIIPLPDLPAADPNARARERVEAAAATRLIAHGHVGAEFYYSSTTARYLLKLSPAQHSKNYYLTMAPLEYWHAHYGRTTKDGEEVVHWDAVTSSLMSDARKAGDFDPNSIRGRGAWTEETPEGGIRFVFNAGDYLLVDGVRIEIHEYKGAHFYAAGQPIAIAETPLEEYARKRLVEVISGFEWEEPHHATLVIGWLLMATVSGALDWRCMLWLTAQAGSGKSFFIDAIISSILRGAAAFFNGSTTDKGIASALQHDSIVFIYDEAEVADDASKARMTTLLRALRATASGSKGKRAVGSPGGTARTSKLSSAGFCASINDCISDPADEQRWITPKLRAFNTSANSAAALAERQKANREYVKQELTAGFSAKFLAFGVLNFDAIKETIGRFTDLLERDLGNRRFGLHFGTALGCAFFFEHGKVPAGEAEIREWLSDKKIGKDTLIDRATLRTERDQVVEALLQAKIEVIDGTNAARRYSIGELLRAAFFPGEIGDLISATRAHDALLAHGIKADRASGRVRLGTSHRKLLRIFEATSFGKNAFAPLREMSDEDDKAWRKPYYFVDAGTFSCVAIKLAKLIGAPAATDTQFAEVRTQSDEALADRLLRRIATASIPTPIGEKGTGRFSVAVLIDAVIKGGDNPRNITQQDAKRSLAQYGLGVDNVAGAETKPEELFVAVDHPNLQRLLGRDDNAKTYGDILAPYASRNNLTERFDGIAFPTIAIPLSTFFRDVKNASAEGEGA